MPRFLDLSFSAFFHPSVIIIYFSICPLFPIFHLLFSPRSSSWSYWNLKQIICLIFTTWFILCLIGRKSSFFLCCLSYSNIQLKSLPCRFFISLHQLAQCESAFVRYPCKAWLMWLAFQFWWLMFSITSCFLFIPYFFLDIAIHSIKSETSSHTIN